MDYARLEKFDRVCAESLAGAIDRLLKAAQKKAGFLAKIRKADKKVRAIGFITTDDFQGFYLAYDDRKNKLDEYYDWENGLDTGLEPFYQAMADCVEGCGEIDFTCRSDGKWEFAQAFLAILEKNIKQLPDVLFGKHHYAREDILFFATMSDGDYIEEMLDASVKLFNAPQTIQAYGVTQ